MTFDAWIDAVNTGVRQQLGAAVKTEEISWESAMWVGPSGKVVAELGNDGATATISSTGLKPAAFAYRDTEPAAAVDRVVSRLREDTARGRAWPHVDWNAFRPARTLAGWSLPPSRLRSIRSRASR